MTYRCWGTLTSEQVRTIRLEYRRGYKSSYQLAVEYERTPGSIAAIAQGCVYKSAGGFITWPGQYEPPSGKSRGHCWDVACSRPIAPSGWAQRMHLCAECFRINGGKKGRPKLGKDVTLRCRVCRQRFTIYLRPSRSHPKTCSAKCGVQLSAISRCQRPADLTADRLYALYWGQGLTSQEIANRLGHISKDAVRLWLLADGTPRRISRRRRLSCCMVQGCGAPIAERRAWYGKGYGRLCQQHHREREHRRYQFYKEQQVSRQNHEMVRHVRGFLSGLPDSVRSDAEQEVVLALLLGDLAPPLTLELVKPYITRAFKMAADGYRTISLDAPTKSDDNAQTWGQRLGVS